MRAFFAIDLSEDLKEKIFTVGREITKKVDIKLVEKENLHLTLLFLGEISEEEKEEVIREIGGVRGVGKIRLKLGKVEVFPDQKRPHGVWINVEGEKEKLFSLYKKIVDEVLRAGIKLEEKQMRFSPHITIGRFSGRVRGVGEIGDIGEDFMVEKVTFFQSQLSSKGPQYSKIGEFEVK